MLNRIKHLPIFYKAIPIVLVIIFIKKMIFSTICIGGNSLNSLIDFSDLGVVFTGTFFVIGLLLAGTMTDFKESEKIPCEIASNLEAIQDWIFLALKAPSNYENNKKPLDKDFFKSKLIIVTDGVILWINSVEKDSNQIFPLLRKLNEIAYYFSERAIDKEAIKGIQENTNALRKQLTRAYSISRNKFIKPAYTLLQSILVVVISLLMLTKFKTEIADYMVTISVLYIFVFLYFLILGLDDPFNINRGDTEVDLKPIDRFRSRIEEDFIRI
jgi:hypothetical protein